MRPDSYSKLVSWLKVALPLAALALLSTLFLLSRSVDPDAAIPFADKEIQDRLRDQQVTGPFFSGTTTDGDQLSFTAVKLTTPLGQTGANEAKDVLARVTTASGARMTLQADVARFDISKDRAELVGNVALISSTGLRVFTEKLVSLMSTLDITSPGPVHADGPIGKLDAGMMTLRKPNDGGNAQLLFTNGVKLVYTPN